MTDTTTEESTIEIPPPPKPGYLTTEFYLSLSAVLLTYLFASGAVTNDKALAIAGMAATVLTALGYKVSRTLVKTAGLLLLVGLALQPACSGWRGRTAAGAAAFLNCESEHVDPGLLSEAKLVTKSAIEKWISGDGHVDATGLRAEAAPLKSDLMRCAFDAAVAALTYVPSPVPGAPASAPLEVDAAQLRATWAAERARLGWAPAKGGG